MGQRELMLILLVTIIAGIATVVAIDTFQKSRYSANEEAIRQDMIQALGEARKYYLMPGTLKGGGGSFSNISFKDLTLDTANTNGSFELSGNGNTLILTGSNTETDVDVRATATINTEGKMEIKWENL